MIQHRQFLLNIATAEYQVKGSGRCLAELPIGHLLFWFMKTRSHILRKCSSSMITMKKSRRSHSGFYMMPASLLTDKKPADLQEIDRRSEGQIREFRSWDIQYTGAVQQVIGQFSAAKQFLQYSVIFQRVLWLEMYKFAWWLSEWVMGAPAAGWSCKKRLNTELKNFSNDLVKSAQERFRSIKSSSSTGPKDNITETYSEGAHRLHIYMLDCLSTRKTILFSFC